MGEKCKSKASKHELCLSFHESIVEGYTAQMNEFLEQNGDTAEVILQEAKGRVTDKFFKSQLIRNVVRDCAYDKAVVAWLAKHLPSFCDEINKAVKAVQGFCAEEDYFRPNLDNTIKSILSEYYPKLRKEYRMTKERADRITELAIYTRRCPSNHALRTRFLPLMGKEENEKAPHDRGEYPVCKEEVQLSILQTVREIHAKIDPKEFQREDRNPMQDVVFWCVRWNYYYDQYTRYSGYPKDYPAQMNACFIQSKGHLKVRRHDPGKSDNTLPDGWEKHYHKDSGRDYYKNPEGNTQWDHPKFDKHKIAAVGDNSRLDQKRRLDKIPDDFEDAKFGPNIYAWM